MGNLLERYRMSINPPYKFKDYINLALTLVILLVLPVGLYLTQKSQDIRNRAQEAEQQAADQPKFNEKKIKIETLSSQLDQTNKVLNFHGKSVKKDSGKLNSYRKELAALSKERKQQLLELMEEDPIEADKFILDDETLSAFGSANDVEVESRVSLTGEFVQFHQETIDEKGQATDSKFINKIIVQGKNWKDQQTYTLYGSDKFPDLKTSNSITVSGHKLDDKILVDTITQDNTVLGLAAPITVNLGTINTAVIAVYFSDTPGGPYDMDMIKNGFSGSPGKDTVSYFKEASYNKTTIKPSFFGPYLMPAPFTKGDCYQHDSLTQAIKEAANADVNFPDYKRFVYVVKCDDNANGVGAGGGIANSWPTTPIVTPDGTITGAEVWLYNTVGWSHMRNHELSHTMGNGHAQSYNCTPDGFIPPTNFDYGCNSVNYGDGFDVLGHVPNGLDDSPHLNASHKYNAGWFDSNNFISLTTPGTYTHTIAPIEASSSSTLALYIPRGNTGTGFTVEYRQPIGFDAWITEPTRCPGVCNVSQGANIKFTESDLSTTGLLDLTPFSQWGPHPYPGSPGSTITYFDYTDGALTVGKTFTDPEYGISITTNSVSSSGVNVTVTIPSSASCVRNTPSAVISPASQSGPAGQTPPYTITLTNNDSAGCPAQKFRPGTSYGSGGYNTVDPDVITLAPGASKTISLVFNFPSNTANGTQTIAEGFGANTLGVGGATVQATYVVTSSADTTAPTSPTNLSGSVKGSKQVDLSWIASTDNVGVLGYYVFRDGAEIGTTDTPSFSDYYALPSVNYSYAVQAYDRQNNPSAPSQAINLTTKSSTDTEAPSVPTNLSAQVIDAHTIKLNWAASTDNTEVTRYYIWSLGEISAAVINLPGTTTTLTNKGLYTNSAYTYHVQACDGFGNCSQYNLNSLTITTPFANTLPPTRPTNFKGIAVSPTRSDLFWDASSDDKGIAGYTIFKNGRKIGTSTANFFVDTRAKYNIFEFDSVEAYDQDGNVSSPTDTVWVITPGLSFENDSIPPTVSITSPANSTVSGSTTISVSASDNSCVTGTELYVDDVLTTATNTSPFDLVWDTTKTGNGTHTIIAKAYDCSSNAGTSPSISVNVSNASTPTPTETLSPIPTPIPAISLTPTPIPSGPTPTPTPPLQSGIVTFSSISTQTTANIAAVKWTTSAPSTSRVIYGVTPSNLNLSSAENQTLITNHTVSLFGLAKNTRYYFKVISKNALGTEFSSTLSNFRTKNK